MLSFKYLWSTSITQYLKSADGLDSNPIPETNKQYKLEQLVQPPYASLVSLKEENYLSQRVFYLFNKYFYNV